MKICSNCKKEKEEKEFYKKAAECKNCFKIRQKNVRKRRIKGDIKKIIRCKKKCYLCYEEKNTKEFYKDKYSVDGYTGGCKKCIKKERFKYNKNNKEKILLRRRKYYKENKEFVIKKNIEYEKNRRSIDEKYRIRRNIHAQFGRFMKGNKSKKFEDYVGYSYDELIKYLNISKKTKGFHVDHIIPKSLYNLKNEEEIRKCWSLKNLRLISEEENLLKGDTVNWQLIKEHNLYDILPEEMINERKKKDSIKK